MKFWRWVQSLGVRHHVFIASSLTPPERAGSSIEQNQAHRTYELNACYLLAVSPAGHSSTEMPVIAHVRPYRRQLYAGPQQLGRSFAATSSCCCSPVVSGIGCTLVLASFASSLGVSLPGRFRPSRTATVMCSRPGGFYVGLLRVSLRLQLLSGRFATPASLATYHAFNDGTRRWATASVPPRQHDCRRLWHGRQRRPRSAYYKDHRGRTGKIGEIINAVLDWTRPF